MALFERRRRPPLPAAVRAAVPLEPAERVLAWARDEASGGARRGDDPPPGLVDAGGDALVWRRPWHEVEAGTWQGETSQLTVTWVDRGAPARWRVTEPSLLQQTLRERRAGQRRARRRVPHRRRGARCGS